MAVLRVESVQNLLQAIKTGEMEDVKTLLSLDPALIDAMPDLSVDRAPSLVRLAIYYSEPEIADLLIEYGALLDIFDAASAGKLGAVRNLANQEPVLVNAVAEDGFQPLGLAAFFGHFEVAAFLIERGAQVNSASQNAMRVMPLHSAVARQDTAISRLLLEHGADVNAPQADDFTPLHEAAQNGQLEMVRMLLEYGANPEARKADGQTPGETAAQFGHFQIVEFLGGKP